MTTQPEISKEWRLFKKSLRNHPGLTIGFCWPGLVFVSCFTRKDPLPVAIALAIAAIIGLLPWFPILFTAWKLRKQYDK